MFNIGCTLPFVLVCDENANRHHRDECVKDPGTADEPEKLLKDKQQYDAHKRW
jgi:hypothetical protein